MKSKYNVVIIGSGIGGLSAAATLSGHGLDILIVDENAHSGGQLLRKPGKSPLGFSKFHPDLMKAKGGSLIQKITASSHCIDKINQTQVLGIFIDGRILIHAEALKDPGNIPSGRILEIEAEHLVLATGARERTLPFKGWTLPGVMSLGAAQVENPFRKKLSFLPLIPHHWPKLLEGAFYTAQMMWNWVSMINSTRIIEARGKDKFGSVVVAKTTSMGHVINGTETEFTADALAIGYGFVPNIELAVQAGCDIEYQKARGGWIVSADKNLETSIDSIFAVGEITGIAGAKKSYIQGKIAAISILKKVGRINAKKNSIQLLKQMKRLRFLNQQQTAYAAFLNHLCHLPSVAYQEIPDDTLICRCENITMGTIKKAIQQDFTTSGGLKKATRCGMGRCQGRICGPVIVDIIMALTKKAPEAIGPTLSRAPVKNVAIRSYQPY